MSIQKLNIAQQKVLIAHLKQGGDKMSESMKTLYQNYHYENYLDQYTIEYNTSIAETKDFLQEAFITFIKKAKKPSFTLEKDVNVYITSIAKNLIQNHSRRIKTLALESNDQKEYGVSEPPSILYLKKETQQALKEIMAQLNPKCRKLLRFWSHGYSYDEIARKLNFTSGSRARQQKHRCMQSLLEYLPLFPQLKDFTYGG